MQGRVKQLTKVTQYCCAFSGWFAINSQIVIQAERVGEGGPPVSMPKMFMLRISADLAASVSVGVACVTRCLRACTLAAQEQT